MFSKEGLRLVTFHPFIEDIRIRNSYKKFALMQKMDVDVCSAWVKLGFVVTKWRQRVTRKSGCF